MNAAQVRPSLLLPDARAKSAGTPRRVAPATDAAESRRTAAPDRW